MTNQETTRVRISTSTFSMPSSNAQPSDTPSTLLLTSSSKQTTSDINTSAREDQTGKMLLKHENIVLLNGEITHWVNKSNSEID